MSASLRVLALAALPALGNLSGVLLAEPISVSRHTRSLALHSAAGVVPAIVGVVLMPRALDWNLPRLSVLSFALGGAAAFRDTWNITATSPWYRAPGACSKRPTWHLGNFVVEYE